MLRVNKFGFEELDQSASFGTQLGIFGSVDLVLHIELGVFTHVCYLQ